MFEQSALTYGPAGKKVWTTMLGFTSQAALVSLAVLAPMVWPQVLPTTSIWESLIPPLPPGPKPIGDRVQKTATMKAPKGRWVPLGKYEPDFIPRGVTQLIDEPAPTGTYVPGALTSTASGPGSDLMRTIVGSFPTDGPRVARPLEPAPPKPTPIPEPIGRYTVGGKVRLGEPLHKVIATYPAIAKATHTWGDVTLECVVGTDGHIKEVQVKSGPPLLVKAAVEAAWQWVYAPSRLNDAPIEIVTILTFNFKLN